MARSYRPENPDLPTLDPWRNTTPLPAEQFVFERNPYYHRVDENGLQLPYIDRFVLSVSSSALIPAKTGTGESDLQANGIDFVDYTYLKDAEKRYPVEVKLWKKTSGSRLALLPNLNCADPVWRALLRDVRVRRALSLAIDRREINMTAEEIPAYEALLQKVRGKPLEEVSEDDAIRIIRLCFGYIEPRHRFGLLTEDLMVFFSLRNEPLYGKPAPCLRQRSATFAPASCSFSTAIICSSVNLCFFMSAARRRSRSSRLG